MAENSELEKNVINGIDHLNINSPNDVNGSFGRDHIENDVNNGEKWGFPLNDLYKLGLKFYKGKRIHLLRSNPHMSYEVK